MSLSSALVTGGAGFIGSNLVDRLLSENMEVTIFDNLSRSGCKMNIDWLRKKHGDHSFRLVEGDVTQYEALVRAAEGVDRFYHLAGQVAVTTSVRDPRRDFMDNALGTFNALEAARIAGNNPVFIYASTNKVYGGMEDVGIIEGEKEYHYTDMPLGVPETRPLDFHSPYGCSKGAGDQYARDYFRIYGLRTIVMRQSCIYGMRQFGIEDQGWLAWFMIAVFKELPISIYGNGKQVRDVLFISDLLDAYEEAVKNVDVAAGQIFNIGGGPENKISIWGQFGPMLEELIGRPIPVKYEHWRPGDQPIYVSDIRKIKQILGWQPKISVQEGIVHLFEWIRCNVNLFSHL